MLSDIHRFSKQFKAIDVPRPLAVIYTLLGVKPPDYVSKPLLHALKAWSEIGDISEAEGFDGHRKTIVEHTLNILVLPGVHADTSPNFHSTDTLLSPSSHPIHPALRIPGTSLNVPSPLHFRMPIITRLSFNEQGRITHHRDFWDIKDLMRLIPGVPLAQWISSRMIGFGLTYIARSWMKGESESSESEDVSRRSSQDLESGPLAANSTYPHITRSAE
ncbi:hypothetical protein V5O48_001493 [Marasmius crinis-equi]|uniref:SnoaL-like domain-containing protein n=1 Tax=Marasmius crinis-equi TaxID=585013 RepID=A0ABR3FY85_9AGAR